MLGGDATCSGCPLHAAHRFDKGLAGWLLPSLLVVKQGRREVTGAAARLKQLGRKACEGPEAGQSAVNGLLGACSTGLAEALGKGCKAIVRSAHHSETAEMSRCKKGSRLQGRALPTL